MHLIRRSALRAASSPATSFISSRSISTSTPFVLRTKTASLISTSVFKRAYSDESKPVAADGEQSQVNNAVDSVSSGGYQDRAPREYQPRESRPYDSNRGGDRPSYGGNRGSDRGGRGGYGGDRGGSGYNRGVDRGGYSGGRERTGPPREYAPREVVPGPSIYIGNLLFDVTAKDITREFESFGAIKDVVIATDARGLSKGFAYVEFESQDMAAAAIEAKHQSVLEGRRLVVNYMSKSTRERPENPPSKTLFIGNLAFEMSDADLNKLFRDIRNVIDVRVAIDRRTGQPRGFAHADFVDTESATKGKEALLGKEVYGRKLRVDFSAGSRESRGDGAVPGRD